MSEAYLFGWAQPDAPPAKLFEEMRVRPAWVEEIYWVGDGAPHSGFEVPLLRLPPGPAARALALRAAISALRLEDRALILVGGDGPTLLLGGPATVGLRNLPPQARLQVLPLRAGAPVWESAARLAADRLPEGRQVTLVAAGGELPPGWEPVFDAARPLPFAPLTAVVEALESSRPAAAVWLDEPDGGASCFLVERL